MRVMSRRGGLISRRDVSEEIYAPGIPGNTVPGCVSGVEILSYNISSTSIKNII